MEKPSHGIVIRGNRIHEWRKSARGGGNSAHETGTATRGARARKDRYMFVKEVLGELQRGKGVLST